MAADTAWKTKPTNQWTEQDAKQVLTSSPWVKEITAGVARRQSEDERREGGNMGQPTGVGYDGVDPKGSGPKLPSNPAEIFIGGGETQSARSKARAMMVQLRWESALPVRIAELKAHELEPPTLEGEGYRLAVYGVPGTYFKGDPKHLGDPLKKMAFLKREGKKDVRPVSTEVFQRSDGVVVVYLFPFSAEISKKDGLLTFDAQIGRIIIKHSFNLAEMEFQGKLEL